MYEAEDEKHQDVYHYDTGACGCGIDIGGYYAQKEAEEGEDGGAEDDTAEGSAQAHGGEGGEDDESGYEERSHEAHAQYDRDGGQKGDEHVVEIRSDTGCGCEGLVEGDGEDFVVKEDKDDKDDDGKDDGQGDVVLAHRQDAAEHVVAYIQCHSGGLGDDHDADGQGACRYEGDGGVAFDLAAVADSQEEKGCEYDDGDGDDSRRSVECRGDGECAEADM